MGFDILGNCSAGCRPAVFITLAVSTIPVGRPPMSDGRTAPLLRHLRKLAESPTTARPPDRELLRRFARHRDDDAFAVLVRRHGPMVWHVCARVLGDGPDAEDAFQATF